MVMDLTPTQTRIMEVLKDGRPHPVAELWTCLYDELAQEGGNALRMCMSYLRTRLETKGMTVVATRMGEQSAYRLARFIGDDDE